MIDNDTLERIALRVLDVPDPDGAADLDRELSAGCHSRYLCEMEDLAAELALAAPECTPPVRALGRALVEVGSEMTGGGREPQSRLRWPWLGAAAAAAALVLAAFLAGRGSKPSDPTTAGGGGAGKGHPEGPSVAGQNTDGSAEGRIGNGGGDSTDRVVRRDGAISALPRKGARPWRELETDVKTLREAVAKLRSEREGRFIGAGGLSRTVVVEMDTPGAEREEANGPEFSRLVGDALAAALTGDTAPEEIDPVEPDDPDADPVPDAEGQTPSNPVETLPEAGLPQHIQELREGFYFDFDEQKLWVRSEVDGLLVHVETPTNFDYDELEDYPEIDALVPGTLPAPLPEQPVEVPETATEPLVLEEELPAPVPAEVTTGEPAVPPAPFAYSIFHETTGEGSIIVSNLPPAATDKVYQLWVRDSLNGQMLPVGSLPENLAVTERVDFPPGLLGVSPSGFLLTLEEDTGDISQPRGAVVLQGPQPTTSTP